MSKYQRAIESLYSAASLTDELRDDEAEPLLKWGEGMAAQLDSEVSDEDTYDQKIKQVRRVLKRINRFIGAGTQGDAAEARDMLEKLAENAAELGVTIPPEQIDHLLNWQRTHSNGETVGELLAVLRGSAANAPTPPNLDRPALPHPTEGTNDHEQE
jgi:hypothetical protein